MRNGRAGWGEGEDGQEATRLRARLDRALEVAADAHDRSLALSAIAVGLRERRLRVRTCAWCESISLGGPWHRVSCGPLVGQLSREAAATHGICPSCFAKFLPDVPYPTA